jgi:hypothetical protein
VVVLDEHLESLSDRLVAYVERAYRPTAIPQVMVRSEEPQ